MIETIYSNEVSETVEQHSISYTFKDESLFFATGYKVLQVQEKNGFVKCVRLNQNGRTKLVYDTAKYQSLQILLPHMLPESFIATLHNLIDAAREVKSNGYILCESVDTSFDKVFVDTNTLKTYLIYLPINIKTNANSVVVFENALIVQITNALTQHPNLVNDLTRKMKNYLDTSQVTLDDLQNRMRRKDPFEDVADPDPVIPSESTSISITASLKKTFQLFSNKLFKRDRDGRSIAKQPGDGTAAFTDSAQKQQEPPVQQPANDGFDQNNTVSESQAPIYEPSSVQQDEETAPPQISPQSGLHAGDPLVPQTEMLSVSIPTVSIPIIVLEAINSPQPAEIVISKPEFVIGKSPGESDYCITFNRYVSKTHCRIFFQDGRFFIMDLNSINKTYVNNVIVAPGTSVPVQVGDKIKLANSEFFVKEL